MTVILEILLPRLLFVAMGFALDWLAYSLCLPLPALPALPTLPALPALPASLQQKQPVSGLLLLLNGGWQG